MYGEGSWIEPWGFLVLFNCLRQLPLSGKHQTKLPQRRARVWFQPDRFLQVRCRVVQYPS